MSKMLTTAQIAANLSVNPFEPLVGVIDRDNCEWAYNAHGLHKLDAKLGRAFL